MSTSNLTGDCAINGVGHGIARVPIIGLILGLAAGTAAYCNQPSPCDGVWAKNAAGKMQCFVDSGK